MDVFRTQLCVTFDHARRLRLPPHGRSPPDGGRHFLWWKILDEANPWHWPDRIETGLDEYECGWKGQCGPEWRVQVVLRLYASPAEVLHDFDLGACMVLWDGRRAWTTALGRLAAEQALSIVDLTVRRPGYERRLKKYHHLGYDLVLPELDVRGVRDHGRWVGGWMRAYVGLVLECGCCLDLRHAPMVKTAELASERPPSEEPSPPSGGLPSEEQPAAERARQAAYDHGQADQESATVYSSEVARTGQNIQAAAAAHRAALAAAKTGGITWGAGRVRRGPSRGVRCAHARYSPGMRVLQLQPQLRPEVLEVMVGTCWYAATCTSIAATVARTGTGSVLGRLRRLLGEERLDALLAAALHREPGHDSPEAWAQVRAACVERCAELAPYLTLPVEWMRLGMAHSDECGVELREWYGADYYRRDG